MHTNRVGKRPAPLRLSRASYVKWLIVSAAVLALSSCSSEAVTVGSGVHVLPSSTAQDWVTYSDYAIPFTVTAESRGVPDPVETERDEGLIMRTVVADLSEPIWRRPGVEIPAPTSLNLGSGGWIFHGDKEEEFRLEGQVDLFVDKQYLAILTYTDLGNESLSREWVSIAFMSLEGDRLAEQEGNSEAGFPVRRQLIGRTLTEAQELLEGTARDPKAEPYMDLDPADRYQATLR